MSNDAEWEPKTAQEAFINSLVNDVPPVEMTGPTPSAEPWVYRGEYIYHGQTPKITNPYSAIRSPRIENGMVVEMPLQPYKGVLRGRLDNQAKEVRQRLENPRAVVLVVRGRNYSATSVFRVFLLFLKTMLFGLPKPAKPPKKKALKRTCHGSCKDCKGS